MSSRDFYASNSAVVPPNSFTRKNTIHQSNEEPIIPKQSETKPPPGKPEKTTVDAPYDAGNAPERPSTPSQQPTDISVESPSTTQQGSGLPEKAPSPAQTQKITGSKEKSEAAKASPANLSTSKKSTGVAGAGGDHDASKDGAGKETGRQRNLERDYRDVSPGTMDDGTHAITSGDRGESYEPSAMSKIKNMFHK